MTPDAALFGVALFLSFFVGTLFGMALTRSADRRAREDLEGIDA